MRRKIEIVTDDPLVTESAPVEAPQAQAPEFGDHINPPGERATARGAEGSEGTSTRGEETTATADNGARRTDTGTSAYVTALQAEIAELRAQKEEAEKRALYLQAEFQNYRRRKEDENAGLVKYANGELIRALLPVVDSFERAIQSAEQSRNFDALIGGISGTMKQMQSFLQKAGVTSIETAGKEFDPNYHEAIGHVEDSGLPTNTVAEEVQRGYILHDRVLRPALVKVAD